MRGWWSDVVVAEAWKLMAKWLSVPPQLQHSKSTEGHSRNAQTLLL